MLFVKNVLDFVLLRNRILFKVQPISIMNIKFFKVFGLKHIRLKYE